MAVGQGEAKSQELLESYTKWVSTRVPFVVAKYAMSLDGKIATETGESRWITGEAARRQAHRLRQSCDAVIVGIGTALQDDPQLTARDRAGRASDRQPLRVIVDSRGRLKPEAQLLRAPGRTLVAAATLSRAHERSLYEAGAEVLPFPAEDGRVDLRALLQELGRREITSALVEGGGTLLASLFQQRLVDKVMAFIAPTIIGGKDAPTPVEGRGASSLMEALRLERVTTKRLGQDLLVVGYPKKRQ